MSPATGPGFSAQDVPLTEQEIDHYGAARTVKRLYQIGGHRFLLTVVDGSNNRHAVHDPMYCYRGAGWQVVGRQTMPIEDGTAEVLRLANGQRETEVMLWFSDGLDRYTGAMRYWWDTTVRRLTLGRSGREPVLVILQRLDDTPVSWHRLIDRFAPLQDI